MCRSTLIAKKLLQNAVRMNTYRGGGVSRLLLGLVRFVKVTTKDVLKRILRSY